MLQRIRSGVQSWVNRRRAAQIAAAQVDLDNVLLELRGKKPLPTKLKTLLQEHPPRHVDRLIAEENLTSMDLRKMGDALYNVGDSGAGTQVDKGSHTSVYLELFEKRKRAADMWFAAMDGDCEDAKHSKYSYAICLLKGNGISRNTEEAISLLTELDAQEHGLAQQLLAAEYLSGENLDLDGTRAIQLLKKSSKNGIISALTTMGVLKRTGKVRGSDVLVKKKPDEARLLLDMAGKYGDRNALYALSTMYVNGEGGSKCDSTGFVLAHKAATQTSSKADAENKNIGSVMNSDDPRPHHQWNLGNHYYFGVGTPINNEKAAEWYTIASDRGYAPAQINLGIMYRDGRGVERDVEKAKHLFRVVSGQPIDTKNAESTSVSYKTGNASPERAAQAYELLQILEANPDYVMEQTIQSNNTKVSPS